MKKAARGCGLTVFWLFAFVLLGYFFWLHSAKTAYDRELARMNAAGIPLTEQDVLAIIPKVAEADNAAADFRLMSEQLKRVPKSETNVSDLLTSIGSGKPNPVDLGNAKLLLSRHAEVLRALESAGKKSGLDFHRDWSEGFLVLFPEYAQIKNGAKLLALRFYVAVEEGRIDDAISDARLSCRLGQLLYQEPNSIAYLVARAVEAIAVQGLLRAAHFHPELSQLLVAAEELTKKMHTGNFKNSVGWDAYSFVAIFEMAKDDEKRKEMMFGMEPEPPSIWERISNLEPVSWQANALILRDCRQSFELSHLGPREFRNAKMANPKQNFLMAMAYKSQNLDWVIDFQMADYRPALESGKCRFLAAVLALKERKNGLYPATLDLSRIDGWPEYLKGNYMSNGKTFSIEVVNTLESDSSSTLWIPVKPKGVD